MIVSLISCATTALAAGLIYLGWRGAGAVCSAVGWLLAGLSVFVWSRALGAEIGVSYAIAVFCCLVWLAIFLNREMPKARGRSSLRPLQHLRRPGTREALRQILVFLLSVPAMGAIAMMLSVALVLYLPWSMLHKVTVAIFLYPLLWGAFGAWICAQEKLMRPALASVALFIVAGLLLFI